jgi:transcriptional regulator of acetoin/glycerol metabolism
VSLFPKELLLAEDYRAYLCSPAELEASYTRCRLSNVPVELEKPQKILPKTAFALRLAINSLLLTIAEQVITPDCYAGPQKDYIYILCDPELVALKILASPEVLTAAEEAGVKPGTVFTEESCGTNALALARKHGSIVVIRGEQHYCQLFKDWWCVAGPVKDPEGQTLGYLDISMHAAKELGSTVALLETLLTSVERELLLLELQQTGIKLPPPSSLLPEVKQELTLREKEVLRLLLSGLTNIEIGAELSLSIYTIGTHRRNIYRKLDVRNLSQLLRKFEEK